MADKTVTVRPSGGDYASLAAAIAGELVANADLTAAGLDGILTFSIEGTWSSADTAVSLSGFTVDSAHYPRIVNQATGYRIESADYTTFGIAVRYARVTGISARNTNGGRIWNIDAQDCVLDSCTALGICEADDGAFYCQVANITLVNCLAYGISGGSGFNQNWADGMRCYNCVAVNCAQNGFNGHGRDITLKNCYAGGNTGDDYAGTGTVSLTTCYSEDGSLSTPTAAYSTATFVNVTVGSEDFHLVSGSALADAGTDLSADASFPFDWDFEGTTRTDSWDVGAYDFSASTPVPVFMNHYKNQGVA